MSAPLRFTVNLMVGRTLTLELDARDAQAAEDIATFLYGRFGDRHFHSSNETSFDCIVDPIGEAAQ
jgi:hypothetical protein